MVFNSVTFLLFLPLVLLLYFRMGHRNQNRLLVVASYVFYGWWDWRFLGLLLFTTFFDYGCSLLLDKEPNQSRRKWLLAFSMAMNLTVIGFFKYFNFFADSFERLLHQLGMRADFPTLNILLPVGISFYTFLSMSYTIDVYRRQIRASRNPLDFALYVSFFPHLVAGPIMRARDLLPQCSAPRVVNREQITTGVWLCLVGYLKKVVIADRLAGFVDSGFSASQPMFHDANSWLLLYAFAFQIYGDFSGYSDIARGLSKLMGFELVQNFKAPYLASNPASFWKQWHVSLSVWLRDYLYIPLGGNRGGALMTCRNLMLTMILGGLWHGAGAAFLAWGCYHGVLLVVHRITTGGFARSADDAGNPGIWHGPTTNRRNKWIAAGWVVLFFHLTCIGWLLFRAGSLPPARDQLETVLSILRTLWLPPHSPSPHAWAVFLLGGLGLFFQWKHEAMDRFTQWSQPLQAAAVAATLTAIASLGVFEGSQFIYFQF